jgi:hypothetical protein
LEEAKGEEERFSASQLVKPGEFYGFEVSGDFEMEGRPARVMVMISGRILELEFQMKRDFEVVIARLGELDLNYRDRKVALERAGFRRGFGQLYFSGSEETEDLERFFVEGDVLPPLALETPSPLLPSSRASLPDPVVVKVSAYVSRSGGLRNLVVEEGVDKTLDRMALETVQNSWSFLPAIAQNKIAEAQVKLNVVFRRR